MDEQFANNWEQIATTRVYAGAYHFFSFESSGSTQAENYIKTVGSLDGKMVPAVDVEYYGKITKKRIDVKKVREELRIMLTELEAEYHKKPVIYCTYKSYMDIIKGTFDDYDLWIRNVYLPPETILSKNWTLWQYSDKEVYYGYKGEEKYIDMNVFNGKIENFFVYNGISK